MLKYFQENKKKKENTSFKLIKESNLSLKIQINAYFKNNCLI